MRFVATGRVRGAGGGRIERGVRRGRIFRRERGAGRGLLSIRGTRSFRGWGALRWGVGGRMFEGGWCISWCLALALVFGVWVLVWCINGVVGRIEASRPGDGRIG